MAPCPHTCAQPGVDIVRAPSLSCSSQAVSCTAAVLCLHPISTHKLFPCQAKSLRPPQLEPPIPPPTTASPLSQVCAPTGTEPAQIGTQGAGVPFRIAGAALRARAGPPRDRRGGVTLSGTAQGLPVAALCSACLLSQLERRQGAPGPGRARGHACCTCAQAWWAVLLSTPSKAAPPWVVHKEHAAFQVLHREARFKPVRAQQWKWKFPVSPLISGRTLTPCAQGPDHHKCGPHSCYSASASCLVSPAC